MKLKITVHGVSYEVEVEVLDAGEGFPAAIPQVKPSPAAGSSTKSAAPPPPAAGKPAPTKPEGASEGSVASPIAGTVMELKCKAGDEVQQGQVLLVIEAMKMETAITAHTAGKIKSIPVAVGDSVREGQLLVEFE